MQAFELVSQHLGIPPFKNVFCALYSMQRGMERGGGFVWVSFRQKEKMFDIFVGKVSSWKKRYFLVKPKSAVAFDNLLRALTAPLPTGGETPVRAAYFPLRWSDSHYKFKPNDFSYAPERLIGEERLALDKLRVFVRGFKSLKLVSADGDAVSVTLFIDTHGLLIAEDPLDQLGISLVLLFLTFFLFYSSCYDVMYFFLI